MAEVSKPSRGQIPWDTEVLALFDRVNEFSDVDPTSLATDAEVTAAVAAHAAASDPHPGYLTESAAFATLAADPGLLIAGSITRDSNGAATSAPVVWPDGTPGTYTATTLSTAFPGAVDAYTITYGSPVTRTYTQPAVTRDAAGAVTARPAIVVS